MRIGVLMALLFLSLAPVLADVRLSPMDIYWLDFSEVGVDTDGDGLKEAIVEIDVPSLPVTTWMEIFSTTSYGKGKFNATLITPGRVNFEYKEWENNTHVRFRIPNVLSGTYKLLVEEMERNSLIRIMTPIYEIRDNLIIAPKAPAKWNGMDIYANIDERGFSPVIWEISPQIITVNPGEEFNLKINLTIRQFSYFPSSIIWQVFLLYSWSPTWPPTRDYYVALYNGIPSYSGHNIVRTIKVKSPETPGEYYIWVAMNMALSVDLAINQITSKPPLPAHVKVIVQSTQTPTPTPTSTPSKIYSCTEITQPGYYKLVNDIYGLLSGKDYCIGIFADNVVLDGQGFSISGEGSGNGIYVRANNTTINYVKIFEYVKGIHIDNILLQYGREVYHWNTYNNTILNSTISNNQIGIKLWFTDKNTIMNCNILNNGEGIYLSFSKNNSITKNTISSNKRGINLDMHADDNIVVHNKILNNYCGIFHRYDSFGNLIYDNLFNNTRNVYVDGLAPSTWNTTLQQGKNILGGNLLGGNAWLNPNGTGFSQTCKDEKEPYGICDESFSIWEGSLDYLPLKYPPPEPKIIQTEIKIFNPKTKEELEIAPLYRPFGISLQLTNVFDKVLTLKVALEERVGFIAGKKYGDGDEIVTVTLKPRETTFIEFSAEVYGLPRKVDYAHIRIYEGKELVEDIWHPIEFKLDYVTIETLLFNPYVKVNRDLLLKAVLSYDLTYTTKVEATIVVDGRIVKKEDVFLDGSGKRILDIIVPREVFKEIGFKSIKFSIYTYLPEKGWIDYDISAPARDVGIMFVTNKEFTVQVVSAESNFEGLSITGGNIYLEYRGNRYLALYLRNTTDFNCAIIKDNYERLKCISKMHGWVVFDYKKFEPVKDDQLHKELAFISEIAYNRLGTYSPNSLSSSIEIFNNMAKNAIVLTNLEAVSKALIKVMKTLITIAFPPYGVYAVTVEAIDVSVKSALDCLVELDIPDSIKIVLDKFGLDVDYFLNNLAIVLLESSTKKLEKANELLLIDTSIMEGSMNVKGEEALEFYSYYSQGWPTAFAAHRFLGIRFSDEWKIFKYAVQELIGISAQDIYDKLVEIIKRGDESSNLFKGIAVQRYLMKLNEEFVKNNSIDFRNALMKNIETSYLIKVEEPKGQKKLLMTVYDSLGRSTGYESAKKMSAEIPNSMCIDLGFEILVIVPANDTYSIVIDASLAEEELENYDLTVMKFSDGVTVESDHISANIPKGERVGYLLSEDSEGITITTTNVPQPPVRTPTINQTTPVKKPFIPGFEALVAIAGLFAVAYLTRRRR